MINSKDISFVLQGAFEHNITKLCISSSCLNPHQTIENPYRTLHILRISEYYKKHDYVSHLILKSESDFKIH